MVRGRVDGRIQLGASLTVEEGAVVQADVQARVVFIAGVVVGSVTASESVRLTEKARVVGDLSAPRVVIEAGAAYRGRVEMGEVELSARSEARASARRSSERDSEAPKAPPRLATPARTVTSAPAATLAPRVATAASVARTSAPIAAPRPAPPAPPRPAGPPVLPRPDTTASGGIASGPAWAKKKLRRR